METTFAHPSAEASDAEREFGTDSEPALRFAPSPNGYLHLGHAYSALANERIARRLGAKLLLRLENIDAERCRSEFEEAIVEDLDWLGVAFEPAPRRQAEHFTC
jgi:glutamyl-Q tRNA(Asp) synthetase